MYLIWPRYEISAQTGYTLPYTSKCYYNLVKNRDQSIDKPCHFFLRFSAELGFLILSVSALIEGIAYLAFGILAAIFSSEKETERRVVMMSTAMLTSVYALYSVLMNIFVKNLTNYVFHFDLFMRPYAHQSIFLDACRTGSVEAAKKLYQMGINPHQKNFYGLTPALYAHIYGHEEIEKFLTCNTYEQEYLELKLLSHWLNISGNATLNNQKLQLQGAVSNWMFFSIAQALSHFWHNGNLKGFSITQQKFQEIEKAFFNAYHPQPSKEIAERIQSSQLCLIDAGWQDHAVCLVFYKSFLAICNRGEGAENFSTINVFRIDPHLVSERIIEEIKTFSSRDSGLGMAYIYHALPGILSPTGDPIQDAICLSFKEIAPKYAKMGNCTLTAKKAALRFAWIVSLNDEPSKKDLKQGTKETKLFTDWAASYYFQATKPYDKFYGLDIRNEFIARAIQMSIKKKNRHQDNLKLLKA